MPQMRQAIRIDSRRRPKPDAFPENHQYIDNGCDLWQHCLTCPLPQCRYDEATTGRRFHRRQVVMLRRDREIAQLRQCERAISIHEVARRLGVSRRTVIRSLRRGLARA